MNPPVQLFFILPLFQKRKMSHVVVEHLDKLNDDMYSISKLQKTGTIHPLLDEQDMVVVDFQDSSLRQVGNKVHFNLEMECDAEMAFTKGFTTICHIQGVAMPSIEVSFVTVGSGYSPQADGSFELQTFRAVVRVTPRTALRPGSNPALGEEATIQVYLTEDYGQPILKTLLSWDALPWTDKAHLKPANNTLTHPQLDPESPQVLTHLDPQPVILKANLP
jgi:hypothetical protein